MRALVALARVVRLTATFPFRAAFLCFVFFFDDFLGFDFLGLGFNFGFFLDIVFLGFAVLRLAVFLRFAIRAV
ncbi:MAG: hypothetical protein M3P27_02100 [Acidobacteriota bacterium]|nr:hypothetical protein [Acidobacteriota bacterium]